MNFNCNAQIDKSNHANFENHSDEEKYKYCFKWFARIHYNNDILKNSTCNCMKQSKTAHLRSEIELFEIIFKSV